MLGVVPLMNVINCNIISQTPESTPQYQSHGLDIQGEHMLMKMYIFWHCNSSFFSKKHSNVNFSEIPAAVVEHGRPGGAHPLHWCSGSSSLAVSGQPVQR